MKDGSDPAKIDDTSKPTSTGDDKSGITDFIIPLIIIVIIVIVVALMILLRRPKKQKPEGVPEVVPTFEGAPPLMDTPQPPLLQGEVYQPTDPYADPYQGQDLYGEEPRTPYVEPGMVKEEIYPADEVYNDTNRNTDQFFDTAVDPSQQQNMNGTQYEKKRYDGY